MHANWNNYSGVLSFCKTFLTFLSINWPSVLQLHWHLLLYVLLLSSSCSRRYNFITCYYRLTMACWCQSRHILYLTLSTLNSLNGLVHITIWTKPFIVFRKYFKISTDWIVNSVRLACTGRIFILNCRQ
jgi:hypothetical protein